MGAVDAELTAGSSRGQLAATALLSPYHFARQFNTTVGLPRTSTSPDARKNRLTGRKSLQETAE